MRTEIGAMLRLYPVLDASNHLQSSATRMRIEEIERQLKTGLRTFPEAALRAAVEQREAMTPILLDSLRECAEDPYEVINRPGALLHIHAMFLLAQFRERAAYPLLVRLFSMPGDVCEELMGDLLTEELPRFMAAVCGGDLEPIKGMIENPKVNEYVRCSCMETLVALVVWGEVERATVIEYFRGLFDGKLERDAPFIWGILVNACCDLYPEELLPEIERAYADGLVDTFVIDMAGVRRVMSEGKEQAASRLIARGPILDAITEMRPWFHFQDAPRVARPVPLIPRGTPVRSIKIGRNDPCPCGSGKKYKKCCGR